MKRALRWGVPIAVVVLAVIYVAISYLVAAGVTKAERKEQEDHPTAYGLQFEEVEFDSRKGDVTLKGWYIPGADTGPTLIFVHGIDSVRTGDNAMDLAARLVARGFSVLMFDLRAHGSSGGEKVSGGIHESQDVLGAVDFLVDQGTPPESMGVMGFSMGAGTSVLALAEEPSIRALVADSPYASVTGLIPHEIGRKTVVPEWIAPIFVPSSRLLAGWFFDIDMGKLVPEKAVAGLDYPILVIHGMADTRIPVEHGIRVHIASHRDSSLWLVPEVDHVDAFLTHPEEYVKGVASYFRARLGGN